MLPNTCDDFLQDDAEDFLVAIDKAYSKDVSNSSPHSENGFNAYRKILINGDPIKLKAYNAFVDVPELLQWAVLLLGPNVPFTCTVRNFIDDLCSDVECMIIKNKGVDIHWSSMEDGISTLPFLLTAITKQISHQAEVHNLYSESVNNPQLILCIIPDEGADEYIDEITRICNKIKIVVVFVECSDIANSTAEFRNSLGEEMKEKLIQFLIEQSEEDTKGKSVNDTPNQNKNPSFNRYSNGYNGYNQMNDQDYKNNNVNELTSPKYYITNTNNNNYDNSTNGTKGKFTLPYIPGGPLSKSYQKNSTGYVEREKYYHSNHHDDNTLSPGWSSAKPIYFSKSTNSQSQNSYSSRNNNYSVSPSPTPRRERENTFSSLRNYSHHNSSYYPGTSPINVDKKVYYNGSDINYSVSNNSDVMFISENENYNNKHSRSNTVCNGVISSKKEVVNTPRKYSGSTYSKSYGNNNNYNNYSNGKFGNRNKFSNKRLSMNYNVGYYDKNNEYQYTNPYLEGLNLESNLNNTLNWEGNNNNNNNYSNKNNYPSEHHLYSNNDNRSRNSKYSNRKYYNQDSSSSGSSPTKTISDTRSNRYDRKYDMEEPYYTKDYSDEEELTSKVNDLNVTPYFEKEMLNDKNVIPRYRPPIPPYNDKIDKTENDDVKIFIENNSNNKKVNDNLSRSLPTKNFFSDHNNKKTYENNDWNKNNSNKSNTYNKYGKYNNSNSYKGKSNDNYDDNDYYDNYDFKKDKKDLGYNSTKSSPTRISVDIKSTLKYRAPTPKNIKEGKYISISPEGYHNDSSKNNDIGNKSNYSPKKELKLTQTVQQPAKTPSVEKYVPPNLRNQNKYGNSNSSNSNSNNMNSRPNSFDKPIPSPNLFAATTDKVNNRYNSPNITVSYPKVQSELTKEIQARQEIGQSKSPLIMPSSLSSNNKIIENKTSVITNNNSLLFNSRRHKLNPRTNINNNYNNNNNFNNNGYNNGYSNYNQLNNNEEYFGNVNNSNNNKYYINSMNSYDNSPNSDSNDSLNNYYRTYK